MLGIEFLFDFLVLVGELFGFLDHFVDLFLGESSLIVGDG
jgi:hypothetical protein